MNMAISQPRGGMSVGGAPLLNSVDPAGGRTPMIQQYLRIALRWRYVIIGATVACVMLGLIATLLMTPRYTATSTIEISRESDQVTDFQGVQRATSVADQEFYQTQYGLLRSRSLSERVAAQLRLIDDPKFFEIFGVVRDEPAFVQSNGRFPASGRSVRMSSASASARAARRSGGGASGGVRTTS